MYVFHVACRAARQSMGDAEGAAKAMISALRLSSASEGDDEVPQMSMLASKIMASLEVDSKVGERTGPFFPRDRPGALLQRLVVQKPRFPPALTKHVARVIPRYY